MSRHVSLQDARAFLLGHGVHQPAELQEVLEAFAHRANALFVTTLNEGDVLLQFVRNPSHARPAPGRGNWFCLKGGSHRGLAITDGNSGRVLHGFRVVAPLDALEGTVGSMRHDIDKAIGGMGGQTQIFVPPCYINRLEPAGAVGG